MKVSYQDVEPILSQSQKVLWLTLKGLEREEENKIARFKTNDYSNGDYKINCELIGCLIGL